MIARMPAGEIHPPEIVHAEGDYEERDDEERGADIAVGRHIESIFERPRRIGADARDGIEQLDRAL